MLAYYGDVAVGIRLRVAVVPQSVLVSHLVGTVGTKVLSCSGYSMDVITGSSVGSLHSHKMK